MSEIKRVPLEVSGLHDAVELMASCAIARYKTKDGAVICVKGTPRIHPCKLMASYEDGTLSVSVPETGFMVSIRLDEAMALMMEAADASHNAGREEESDVEKDAASQG